MTNAEKFTEIFGHDLHREYATKTWWEQEFEPLEPSTDAISRQAAIDAFNAFADEVNQDTDIHEAIEIVLNLPSVTPSEKVGHWIKIDDCSNSGYYCSECHKRVVKEGWSDTVKIIKYCPNCGSRMMQEVR